MRQFEYVEIFHAVQSRPPHPHHEHETRSRFFVRSLEFSKRRNDGGLAAAVGGGFFFY